MIGDISRLYQEKHKPRHNELNYLRGFSIINGTNEPTQLQRLDIILNAVTETFRLLDSEQKWLGDCTSGPKPLMVPLNETIKFPPHGTQIQKKMRTRGKEMIVPDSWLSILLYLIVLTGGSMRLLSLILQEIILRCWYTQQWQKKNAHACVCIFITHPCLWQKFENPPFSQTNHLPL